MAGLSDVIEFLNNHESFFIASHINPDGDTLGSALALAFALERLGKKSTVYDLDGVPETYAFLPGAERVISGDLPKNIGATPLMLIDCNAPVRAGLEGIAFTHACVIDHHVTETDFGSVRWIDTTSPATGLMIYDLIKALNINITASIAVNIYTAIVIDTGTFRFPNTNPQSLRAAAELVEHGAKPGDIAQQLYQSWSQERFSLLIHSLSSVELHGAVAFTVLSSETFRQTGTSPSDTENFVNFPLTISDVKVSALMREVDQNDWRVSLRSKGTVDVSGAASKFGGGGHVNAAGCTMHGPLEEVKLSLLSALKELTGLA
jgi:phosphoesterase RecJ-like protein